MMVRDFDFRDPIARRDRRSVEIEEDCFVMIFF